MGARRRSRRQPHEWVRAAASAVERGLPARGPHLRGRHHRLRRRDRGPDPGAGRRPDVGRAALRPRLLRGGRRPPLPGVARMTGPRPPRMQLSSSAKRLVGVPLLYAIASSTVGFSIYFSIGVVADRGLGLTPLIFLGAGLMFALTTMSYTEGGAMFRERGGSSTFARH